MFAVLNYGSYDLWQNYHKVTFDGPNKIIRVNEGVTELDIKVDVFSDWKEWVSSMSDNAYWVPAVRTICGDPTVSGQRAGDIYFLQNNWKLYIYLTKVKVTGVLFSDNFDSAYYDFNGVIQFPIQVASLVSGISSSSGATAADVWSYSTRTLTTAAGPTASEIADAVWDETYTGHDTDGTFGHLLNYMGNLEKQLWVNLEEATNGNGSQESPYNNINDAVDRAEEDGIRTINLIGDITLTRNFNNFVLKGVGEPEVNFNGQSIKNSKFINCRVKGAYTNGSNCRFEDCELLDTAFLEGTYDHCDLGGDLTCQADAVVLMKDCVSNIPGTSRPTISMNAASTAQLSIRGYSGGLTIKDCNNVADRVTVELHPGSLTFDSSCTNGIMVARGVGKFVDQTAGATVTDETVNQELVDDLETKVLELWRIAGLDASNVASITDTSITVGGVTITIADNGTTTTLTRA